jgi:hypothetical protein
MLWPHHPIRVKGAAGGRLRLIHDGYAALRILDDRERILLIDPVDAKNATDVRGRKVSWLCLTGGPWAERYRAAEAVIALGPVVAGPPALSKQLGVDVGWRGIEGLTIEALPYVPPEDTPERGLRARVRRRLGSETESGFDVPPHVLRLEIADGHPFVHLGLSLHAGTPPSFIEEVRPWIPGATVIAGFGFGHGEPFLEWITALRPGRVLLTDQTSDQRRADGKGVELVTPVRDVLVSRGIETHPFVSGTSHRFERDDTVKRW